MDTQRKSRQYNQPPLHLVSSPTPAQPISTRVQNHKQSESPFRYLNERLANEQVFGEKDQTPLADISSSSGRRASSISRATHRSSPSSSRSSTPTPSHSRSNSKRSNQQIRSTTPILQPTAADNGRGRPPRRVSQFERSHRSSLFTRLQPWIPVILYVISSLGFVAAIAFWRTELFQGLDDLSHHLQEEGSYGYAVIFMLIWVTTFPPLPLYSTFITLSGYTYGAWKGAVISYFAALTGAVCVYTLCRTCFRETITSWLSKTTSIKRVIRAIEKRPKLLFMVRLAPYPYNVMNALLAASPTLTFKTYTLCTGLSLFKVIIHTTIGASIHSFAGYHLHKTPDSSDSPIEGQDPTGGDGVPASEDGEGALLSRVSAIVGILLCVAIFIYISWVARKAVDEELEDDELPAHNPEETELFLDPTDNAERGMGEVSFSRPLVPVSSRSSFSDDTQLRPPVPRTSVSLDDPWRRREEQSSTPLRAF